MVSWPLLLRLIMVMNGLTSALDRERNAPAVAASLMTIVRDLSNKRLVRFSRSLVPPVRQEQHR
jgi:hypothetical protein